MTLTLNSDKQRRAIWLAYVSKLDAYLAFRFQAVALIAKIAGCATGLKCL